MILCDGPLCAGKPGQQSIVGDRYKCSICPDTDFCGNCEAHPLNWHDVSHPLIKLRTPDKFVSVSTIFSNEEIEDHRFSKNYFQSTSVTSVQSNSSTLNDLEATAAPVVAEAPAVKEPELKEEERNVAIEAEKPAPVVEEKKEIRAVTPVPAPTPASVTPEAIFVCDSIADKHTFAPNTIFTQTWTVKVVGQGSWPKGTTVTYVGGIAMKPEYGYNASVTQEEMEIGDTVDFSVDFMAPASEIKDVSLTSFWRLTTPDGIKFGPNLWCEIKVAEPKKEPVPAEKKEEKLIDVKVVEVLEEKEEIIEEKNTEAEPASSQMIFPMLPKESPASSTHEFQGVPHNDAPESVVAESVSSGQLIDDDLESTMSDEFENLSEDDFEFVASDGEESISGHH
jgi:next to BRCA1 gene 1 protein